VQKPHDEQARQAARAAMIVQIDGCLQTGDYARAARLLDTAELDFPGDADLAGRRQVVEIARRFDEPPPDATLVRGASSASAPPSSPYDATLVVPRGRAASGVRGASDDRTQVLPGRQPAMPAQELDLESLAPPVARQPDETARLSPTAGPPRSARRPAATPSRRWSWSDWQVWAAAGGAAAILIIGIALFVPRAPAEPAPPQPAPAPAPPPIVLSPPPITSTVPAAEPPPPDPSRLPPPPPRPPAPPAPPPTLARLTIRDFEPGTTVSLDGESIGTIGADRVLARTGLAPGRHTLVFERKGHDAVTVSRELAAGGTWTISGADHVLRPSAMPVQFRADADVEFTITQGAATIGTGKGPTTLPLREGRYQVVSKGPSGTTMSMPLSVSSGQSQVVDVRSVGGMERFQGWTTADGWSTRRGGGFVLYDRTDAEGRYTFTVRLDRNGNPFTTGGRLTFVVGYVDDRNYVRFQLDRNNFYRADVIGFRELNEVEHRHGIPMASTEVHLAIQVSSQLIVHQFRLPSGEWQTIDTWDRQRPLSNLRFGFQLPRNDELTISNFRFYPASR
jgi:hypothetical protein